MHERRDHPLERDPDLDRDLDRDPDPDPDRDLDLDPDLGATSAPGPVSSFTPRNTTCRAPRAVPSRAGTACTAVVSPARSRRPRYRSSGPADQTASTPPERSASRQARTPFSP